jgi:hypothetical protein
MGEAAGGAEDCAIGAGAQAESANIQMISKRPTFDFIHAPFEGFHPA